MVANKNDYYTIGQLSRRTGLSIHTIRYYDSIDLLKPSYVDEETGYRYYTTSDFWHAEIISIFRLIDVSLDEQKAIFQSKDDKVIHAVLQTQKQKLDEEIKHYKQAIKDIDWMQKMLEEGSENEEGLPYIKELPERTVIYKHNNRKSKEYHLTLQKISIDEIKNTKSLQRKYGYILQPHVLINNSFKIDGEYLNLFKSSYKHTDEEHIYKIPKGAYMCQKVRVKDRLVNMSLMRKALKEHGYIANTVIAEEVGMPIFNLDDFYCEIQILLDTVEER